MSEQHSDDNIQIMEAEVHVPRDQINSPSYDDIDNPYDDDPQLREREFHVSRVFNQAVDFSSLLTSKKTTDGRSTDNVYHTCLSLLFSTEDEKYNRILLPASEIKIRFYESVRNNNIQSKIDDEITKSKDSEEYCQVLKEFNMKLSKAFMDEMKFIMGLC